MLIRLIASTRLHSAGVGRRMSCIPGNREERCFETTCVESRRVASVLHVAVVCPPYSHLAHSPLESSAVITPGRSPPNLLTHPGSPCTTFGRMDGASSGLHNPLSAYCTSEGAAAQPTLLDSDLVLSYSSSVTTMAHAVCADSLVSISC